jgi:hypothetical protein
MVNPKVTNIAVPAVGGGFVAINLTLAATSRCMVEEDPNLNAGVAQGLEGYYVDPAIATTAVMNSLANQTAGAQLAALQAMGALKPNVLQKWLTTSGNIGTQSHQPIQFGDWLARHLGYGEYIGCQGDCILLLTSLTSTATGVLLVEWK